MSRAARNLTIAAGLLWLAAVLGGVWMLTRSNPSTTSDWVTLAITVAAAVSVSLNARGVHRDDATRRDRSHDGHPER